MKYYKLIIFFTAINLGTNAFGVASSTNSIKNNDNTRIETVHEYVFFNT